MSDTYVELLPREVAERLERVLLEGKTGKVELDVHEGAIVSARFTESWRVRKK